MAEETTFSYEIKWTGEAIRVQGAGLDTFAEATLDRKRLVFKTGYCSGEIGNLGGVIARLADDIATEKAEGAKDEKQKRFYETLHYAEKTRRVIGRRVTAAWNEALATLDPRIVALSQRGYSLTGKAAPLSLWARLIDDDYIYHDLMTYRACAMLMHLEHPLRQRLVWHDDSVDGLQCYPSEIVFEARIRAFMPNWMSFYAHNHDIVPWNPVPVYGSLRRTLMQMPGGIPAGFLDHICDIRLQRPYVKRSELLMLLAAHSMERGRLDAYPAARNATEAQIRTALARLGAHLRRDLPFRGTAGIRELAFYLNDYPDRHAHSGNLVGLTDRAIHWHRFRQAEVQRAVLDRVGHDKPVALPPIPLPQIEGLRFLSTSTEIVNEGRDMGHCIATYAQRAIHGDCYLFGYGDGSNRASIEVDPSGRISQVQGISNRQTPAVAEAKHAIKPWVLELGRHQRTYTPKAYNISIRNEVVPF